MKKKLDLKPEFPWYMLIAALLVPYLIFYGKSYAVGYISIYAKVFVIGAAAGLVISLVVLVGRMAAVLPFVSLLCFLVWICTVGNLSTFMISCASVCWIISSPFLKPLIVSGFKSRSKP